ncbi:MAG: D-alanyl-D-alanine carboxypeptidase [Ruminococcus sp.]|nr:D-alanyl-D-alanine carboxypeptidase [Ruminococcus sp.]
MRKIIAVFVSFVLLLTNIEPMYTIADDTTNSAKAYVLMEPTTQTFLDSENADLRLNVGYLSKLMTILLIAEDIETEKYTMSTELTASSTVTGTKGAVVWLEAGDKMTVEELLKSVIIGNANDAVTVLAEKSEQTIENFVMRMNTEVFDLGLRNTAFYSPYGYYDEREYTTAHDMAVICSQLAKYEFLRPYFKTWRDFVKSGQTELVSENRLANSYERHIGFKAAHSDETGYNIAEGGMNESGDCYIAVVLGADNEDDMYKQAKSLMKSGFTDYKVTATMFPDEMLMPMKIRGGCDTAVEIVLRQQSRLVVPKSVGELSTKVVLPEYLTAPVKKGQVIGTAAFYSDKNLVCEIDIIVKDDVKKLSVGYIFKEMLCNMIE